MKRSKDPSKSTERGIVTCDSGRLGPRHITGTWASRFLRPRRNLLQANAPEFSFQISAAARPEDLDSP